jgi:hypothetical protein
MFCFENKPSGNPGTLYDHMHGGVAQWSAHPPEELKI